MFYIFVNILKASGVFLASSFVEHLYNALLLIYFKLKDFRHYLLLLFFFYIIIIIL